MIVRAISFNEMGVWPDDVMTSVLQDLVNFVPGHDNALRELLKVCTLIEHTPDGYECWLASPDANPSVCWIDVLCNDTYQDPYLESLRF